MGAEGVFYQVGAGCSTFEIFLIAGTSPDHSAKHRRAEKDFLLGYDSKASFPKSHPKPPPPRSSSFDVVIQSSQNKLAHIKYGNTTVISLSQLLAQSYLHTGPALRSLHPISFERYPSLTSSSTITSIPTTLQLDDLLPIAANPFVYDRTLLLNFRCSAKAQGVEGPRLVPRGQSPLTKTLLCNKGTTPVRSGRRRTFFNDLGDKVFYKKPPPRSQRPRRRIRELHNSTHCRTPPPSGAPGAPPGVNEECPPKQGGAPVLPRGSKRRSARRRAYRRWKRAHKQAQGKGPGPPPLAPPSPKRAPQPRARWFRQSLLWQDHIPRRKKGKPRVLPTTPPLEYDKKLKIGSLNVQGFADTLKLKNAIQLMQESSLDVLMLSETRARSYYSYSSEGYLVILSGNNRDQYAGVGAIVSPKIRPHLADVLQLTNRILHLSFKKNGGNVHIIGVYAPHSGLDHDEIRYPFWDTLHDHIAQLPDPEPVYITGDFNVRFQAQHPRDQGVLGPFVYGKGKQHIDHTATSNRSLCISTMSRLGMVEAASFITPNLMNHISYRDKNAPPKDWQQFLLDPLIPQQVYAKIQEHMDQDAILVSAKIREFLDAPQLLPPPIPPPSLDPTRFQRLDHTFTKKQRLNAVHKCRTKLHTGYPSDHYLLITEIQIKLAAKPPRNPHPRRMLPKVSSSQRDHFNSAFLAAIKGDPTTHSPTSPSEEPLTTSHFYTDGSGTRGKCTANTPAGWGWCLKEGSTWHDAHGPVITQSDHTAFRGAQVGSNNTGEVTAIIEALLYAHQQGLDHIAIHSDSKWAINVITGRWRAKAHKTLINLASRLLRLFKKASLQWVNTCRTRG